MGRFIRFILVLVILVAAGLVAAPFFIPTDAYKTRIAEAAEAQTGRRLEINGDLRFSFLPTLQLQAGDVTFANPSGWDEPLMASADTVRFGLEPWPLLRGEVSITEFVLSGADIDLEVDGAGRANWTLDRPAPAESGTGDASGPRMTQLRLGDVRLVDSAASYRNRQTGAAYAAEDIDASIALDSLDSPLAVEGAFTYAGERVSVESTIGAPRALAAGESFPATLSLRSGPARADFDGEASLGGGAGALPVSASGPASLDIPSLSRFLAWTGRPAESLPAERLSVEGALSMGGQRVGFSDASAELDDMAARGDIAVVLGRARPRLEGALAFGELDLRPFWPQSAETQGWSEAPLEFGFLRIVDAELDLAADSVITPVLRTGRADLALALDDARLDARLTEAALYGGGGTARLVVNARGATPSLSNQVDFSGVDARALFGDAFGFERLEGVGNLVWSVDSAGASQRALVEALSGSGRLMFEDGAINGVNLAAMFRRLQGLASLDLASLDPAAGGAAQRTDFAALGGEFTIANGVLTNPDLRLANPFIRVEGAGQLDLPARSVDYRIVPRLVMSAEGQGGEQDIAGLLVPIRVTGAWNSLSFAPDASEIGRRLMRRGGGDDPIGALTRDPEAFVRAVLGQAGVAEDGAEAPPPQGPEDIFRELLGQAGRGPSDEPQASDGDARDAEEEEPGPEDIIRGLFGDRGDE